MVRSAILGNAEVVSVAPLVGIPFITGLLRGFSPGEVVAVLFRFGGSHIEAGPLDAQAQVHNVCDSLPLSLGINVFDHAEHGALDGLGLAADDFSPLAGCFKGDGDAFAEGCRQKGDEIALAGGEGATVRGDEGDFIFCRSSSHAVYRGVAIVIECDTVATGQVFIIIALDAYGLDV